MRLGFSTNAFVNFDLFYAINEISKIGYDGIELVLDIPHAFLPIKKESVDKIRYCLHENNLTVTNLNANTVLGWHKSKNENKFEPSLSNKDSKLRNWRISYTKQAIDLADSLDCPSVSITSGILNPNDYETELKHFQDSLSTLSDFAERKDVLLAIEYEPELLVNNSEDVWKLVSSDFKNVGLNLDTCHVEVTGEDLSLVIRKFREKIFHTHVSDCKDMVHFHLLPGLGSIDFQKFFDTLNEVKYEGFLTAELYTYHENPKEAASEALLYFKKLMM